MRCIAGFAPLLLTLCLIPGVEAREPPLCAGQDSPGPSVQVASEDEPGEPLVVRGRVLAPDGETPLSGATVMVFHTDAEGYYTPGGMDEEHPRLCGIMRTGPDGTYEFRTIRPAAYATNASVAPHIHYRVGAAGGPERDYTLQFSRDGKRSGAEPWDTVQPLIPQPDGTLLCVRDIRTR